MPALYSNGEYYRLLTYRGVRPFTDDKVNRIFKKTGGGFPWDYWLATENWAALVNEKDWGLGIYKPDNYLFIGGFAGKEGRGGTHDSPTGYIAPLHTEILDHNITYDYSYALILGRLSDIRRYAVETQRGPARLAVRKRPPELAFQAADDQGTDEGWPINGFIQLDLGKQGMAAISPPRLWKAESAPMLHINAAFKTKQNRSQIAWMKYETDRPNPSFSAENSIGFDVVGDGEFRTYAIDLTSAESYTGMLSYLMFKPIIQPEKGGWVKVKRIWFSKEPVKRKS